MGEPFFDAGELGLDEVGGVFGAKAAVAAEVYQVETEVVGVVDVAFDALQGGRVVFAEHGGVEADFHGWDSCGKVGWASWGGVYGMRGGASSGGRGGTGFPLARE